MRNNKPQPKYRGKQRPETIAQDNSKMQMFSPGLQKQMPSNPVDDMIIKRLEEMTRRIDLMQNNTLLSSSTSAAPNGYHYNSPPKESSMHKGYASEHDSPLASKSLLISPNQFTDYRVQEMAHPRENEEMQRLIAGFKESLRDAQTELSRANHRADVEAQERKALEQRNADLNSKLLEARKSLKETQSALQSVQLATEQLANKREQREAYLQQLIADNNGHISKIAILETKLRDAEDTASESTLRRDDFVHRLQDQLGECQEIAFKAQSEATKANGEKAALEGEIDALRQKVSTMEARAKNTEHGLEIQYKTKLGNVEEKLKIANEKVLEFEKMHMRIDTLESKLAEKGRVIDDYVSQISDLKALLDESRSRCRALEEKIENSTENTREADGRFEKSTADLKEAKNQIAQLAKKLAHSENQVKQHEQRVKEIAAENHELNTKISALEQLIENAAELTLELNAAENEIMTLRDNLDASNTERSRLSNLLDEKMRKIEEKDQAIMKSQETIRVHKTKEQELSLRLDESERHRNELSLSVTDLTARLSELRMSASQPAPAAIVTSPPTVEEPQAPHTPVRPTGSKPTASAANKPASRVVNEAPQELTASSLKPFASAASPPPNSSRNKGTTGIYEIFDINRDLAATIDRQDSVEPSRQLRAMDSSVSEMGRQLRSMESNVSAVTDAYEKTMNDSGSEDGGENNERPSGWDVLAMGSKRVTDRKSSLAMLVDFMAGTRRDIERLKEEKKKLKKEIVKWCNDFKEKNGREPEREDKETLGKDLYDKYQKCSTSLKKSESKLKKSEKTFTIKKEVMPTLKEKEEAAAAAARG